MIIGCLKETMQGEGRVSLMPSNAGELLHDTGTEKVYIEKSAGKKSGFGDQDYLMAGASVATRNEVLAKSDLLLTVKGPSEADVLVYKRFNKRSTRGMICGFIHPQNNESLARLLRTSGLTVIDYGSIERNGKWHILKGMSELAGEIAVSDGGYFLHKYKGKIIGQGTTVGILGMGSAGNVVAEKVLTAGARLYAFDKNQAALSAVHNRFSPNYLYQFMTVKFDHICPKDMERLAGILPGIDLLVGCIRTPARNAGRPVPKKIVYKLTPGSVVIDISIDDGGCFELSRKTSADKPTFVDKESGVVYYCVPNMPGTIPKRATPMLLKEVFPYIKEIAHAGFEQACRDDSALRSGVIIHNGYFTNETLAEELKAKKYYKPLEEVL